MGTYTTLKLRGPCVFQFFAAIACSVGVLYRVAQNHAIPVIIFLVRHCLIGNSSCYCRVPSDIGAVCAAAVLKVAHVDRTRPDKLLFNSNERIRMKVRTIAVAIGVSLAHTIRRMKLLTMFI